MDPADHPQPLLRRPVEMLDGPWSFALDPEGRDRPSTVTFDREILVPFAPETPASGIGVGRVDRCWYRRRLRIEPPAGAGRVLLHFGGVDRTATVHVGGDAVESHTGGYAPFAVDVTDHARGGEVDVVVRADDDPTDLEVPRGKQDWLEEPHAIWYPRTTGIWRSVWLEQVPATRLASLALSGSSSSMEVRLEARLQGPIPDGATLAVRVRGPGRRALVDDRVAIVEPAVERTYPIGDGGIDDRSALVWWPRHPVLLDVEVAVLDGRGDVVDRVESYTALRDAGVADGRVLLNGRPYPLRLVLDQGYWRETGLTAPTTDALRRDIELTRALGFNGARKHQKVEDPRYLAWADRLGLLVWVEMPSAYRASARSAAALVREWTEIVAGAAGHPSVIGWVPINESWGVPDVASSSPQRALVTALASIATALGGGRPVSANDGWETAGGDIVGIHDYDQDAVALAARYADAGAVDRLLRGRRPDGRLADLDRRPAGDRAVVLSEFGGVALRTGASGPDGDGAWGYREVGSPAELLATYADLWRAVHQSDVLAGACWTQLTDTYQEINGLLTMERVPKADIDALAAATRGRA
ncbi:MAG TPA: hypothetical protein VHN98_06235 [Acidimicrobiales bacterium]|nr:hypothetical protein [Acidimicrobiales bacterium]